MNTIESITTDDLGRVVVYKSVVMRINHSWKNDIDRYREEGVLLLASNDKHMARLGDLNSSYGQYRLLIQQSLKNLKRGLPSKYQNFFIHACSAICCNIYLRAVT